MQRMMDYDRDIVQEVESKQNLGGREMLSCMRKGICLCGGGGVDGSGGSGFCGGGGGGGGGRSRSG